MARMTRREACDAVRFLTGVAGVVPTDRQFESMVANLEMGSLTREELALFLRDVACRSRSQDVPRWVPDEAIHYHKHALGGDLQRYYRSIEAVAARLGVESKVVHNFAWKSDSGPDPRWYRFAEHLLSISLPPLPVTVNGVRSFAVALGVDLDARLDSNQLQLLPRLFPDRQRVVRLLLPWAYEAWVKGMGDLV